MKILQVKPISIRLSFRTTRPLIRDPYTIATSPDGKRSVILSQQDRQVEGFKVKHGTDAPWRLENPCKAVICEMHIRDFTKSPTSGVSENLRGNFPWAAQTGTVNQYGQATALTISKNSAVIMFSFNQSLIAIRNMMRMEM